MGVCFSVWAYLCGGMPVCVCMHVSQRDRWTDITREQHRLGFWIRHECGYFKTKVSLCNCQLFGRGGIVWKAASVLPLCSAFGMSQCDLQDWIFNSLDSALWRPVDFQHFCVLDRVGLGTDQLSGATFVAHLKCCNHFYPHHMTSKWHKHKVNNAALWMRWLFWINGKDLQVDITPETFRVPK